MSGEKALSRKELKLLLKQKLLENDQESWRIKCIPIWLSWDLVLLLCAVGYPHFHLLSSVPEKENCRVWLLNQHHWAFISQGKSREKASQLLERRAAGRHQAPSQSTWALVRRTSAKVRRRQESVTVACSDQRESCGACPVGWPHQGCSRFNSSELVGHGRLNSRRGAYAYLLRWLNQSLSTWSSRVCRKSWLCFLPFL